MTHARKIVTVEVHQTAFRILDSAGIVVTIVPSTNTEQVTRHKAYGTMTRSPKPPSSPALEGAP
jgi:hypothetical protein